MEVTVDGSRLSPFVEKGVRGLAPKTFILRRLDPLVPVPPRLADDPAAAANQRQLEGWADERVAQATGG